MLCTVVAEDGNALLRANMRPPEPHGNIASIIEEERNAMMKHVVTAVALAAALVLPAGAAEIKVISSVGVKGALEVLKPQFERATEHKLNITYGTAVPLKRQIDGGESFDVVILTPALVEDLAKSGKVAAGTPAVVAKAGIGIAIKQGSPKPDVGSPEALKKAMLAAKAIAYSKEGQSGTAMARVVERLGIANEMAPKTVLETRSGMTAANVVEGKADLAFVLISEILPIAGAELAGPLPAALQNYIVFTAGISPAAKDAKAAQSLIDFLRAPGATAIYKAKGLEPGT
jgi:molybdate transport system substrate-binding protein